MKTAIIVCGSPGVGKTTYGARLARIRRAALIDIDTVTERLVQVGLKESGRDPSDRDSVYFKDTYREPIYGALLDLAEQNSSHIDIIIVGPFTQEVRDPGWPEKLRQRLNTHIEVHYLHCDPEVRRVRLTKRGNPRDQAKLKDWSKFLEYYGAEAPPVFPHRLIDTTLHEEASSEGLT